MRAGGRRRGQALAWLETNRKQFDSRLASGTASDRKDVAAQLSACLTEKDLAGVRPGVARDGWTLAEATAWDAYWADVRAALTRATGGPRPAAPGK